MKIQEASVDKRFVQAGPSRNTTENWWSIDRYTSSDTQVNSVMGCRPYIPNGRAYDAIVRFVKHIQLWRCSWDLKKKSEFLWFENLCAKMPLFLRSFWELPSAWLRAIYSSSIQWRRLFFFLFFFFFLGGGLRRFPPPRIGAKYGHFRADRFLFGRSVAKGNARTKKKGGFI